MKTTAVVESLSYYKTNVLFQRIPAYFKIFYGYFGIVSCMRITYLYKKFTSPKLSFPLGSIFPLTAVLNILLLVCTEFKLIFQKNLY